MNPARSVSDKKNRGLATFCHMGKISFKIQTDDHIKVQIPKDAKAFQII